MEIEIADTTVSHGYLILVTIVLNSHSFESELDKIPTLSSVFGIQQRIRISFIIAIY